MTHHEGHEQPDVDTVEEFSVRVEEQGDGWAVIKTVDGVDSTVDVHPNEELAQRQADTFEEVATRHEKGARVEDVPDSYPGKGVDETDS